VQNLPYVQPGKAGWEEIAESEAFWVSVREQTHAFFNRAGSFAPVDQIDQPATVIARKTIDRVGWRVGWLIIDEGYDQKRYSQRYAGCRKRGRACYLFRSEGLRKDVFHPLRRR
jgi:hypothetical protein